MEQVNEDPVIQVIEAGGGAVRNRRRRRRRAPFGGRRRQRRQENRQRNELAWEHIQIDEMDIFPEIEDMIFNEDDDDLFFVPRAPQPRERHRIGNRIHNLHDYYVVIDSEDEDEYIDIPRDIVDKPEIFQTLETLVRSRNDFIRRQVDQNIRERFMLNPASVVNKAVEAYDIQDGSGVADAEKLLDKMQKLAESIRKMVPPPPPPVFHYQPGDFQLPRTIRENLSAQEIQILEACINVLRNAMINGMQFPGYRAIQDMVNNVRFCSRFDDELLQQGRLTELVEMSVKTDDYKRRLAEYQEAAHRRWLVGRRRSKTLRLPESTIFHAPHIPKDDYELWTEEDIRDWVKLFIHKKEHLDMIESQQFTGFSLQLFLNSRREWKDNNWPFGLYIQLKSHFNRVANKRNGHIHRFR
ncbi:hypothetical protein CAEBREN_13893 [Caenorhabditis brenneri]|uniref:Uncharacterized protein n=1 Tax=Caenorhabditis brenneri TaxID=135651 RepID=G0PDL0_CAEBE|nr:hypothetical protein CAEBREN_13893 [Caenorhabditis brenneri]